MIIALVFLVLALDKLSSAQDPIDCTTPGFYIRRNPVSCLSFYKCDHDKPVLFLCPAGTHFNDALHICDWPENANCVIEDDPERDPSSIYPDDGSQDGPWTDPEGYPWYFPEEGSPDIVFPDGSWQDPDALLPMNPWVDSNEDYPDTIFPPPYAVCPFERNPNIYYPEEPQNP